MACNPTLYGK